MGQDYRDLFVSETREYLQRLETCLLDLEERPGDWDIMDEMFRSAHSLKGMAATMGYVAMVEAAHQLESMLQGVRDGRQEIGATEADTIFGWMDQLKELLAGPEEMLSSSPAGAAEATGAEAVDREVDSRDARSLGTTVDLDLSGLCPDERSRVQATLDAGRQVAMVTIALHDSCRLKAVRARVIVAAVDAHARVIGTNPSRDSMDSDQWPGLMKLYIEGTGCAELGECLRGLGDIESFDISVYGEDATLEVAGGAAPQVPDEIADEVDGLQCITVRLVPSCLLKSVRAYMALDVCRRHGDVISTDPSESDLDADRFDLEFSVTMEGPVPPELLDDLRAVSEIEAVEVRRADGDGRGPAYAAQDPSGGSAASSSSPGAPGAAGGRPGRIAEKTVRVETEKLDSLVNLVGEVVISRTRMLDLSRRSNGDDLRHAADQLNRVVTDLQNSTMRLRMVAVKGVFERFPRMVRDLCRASGKEARLVMSGEDTEMDRTLVDQLSDPLVHLLRNSVDHGIESREDRVASGKSPTATITLKAHHEGSHVVITVSDDGRGIDPDRIRDAAIARGVVTRDQASRMTSAEALDLAFKSGLSTAKEITDVSGRGVGLDAVRETVAGLSGTVEVDSRPGQGTEFAIRLPLTLAIIRALLVRANHTYALPIETIRENLYVRRQDIRTIKGERAIVLRDRVIPLVAMTESLYGEVEEERDVYPVVVLNGAGQRVAVIVDELIGQQEIVIKSLSKIIKGIRVVAGATVLGDGSVVLILDVPNLVSESLKRVRARQAVAAGSSAVESQPEAAAASYQDESPEEHVAEFPGARVLNPVGTD